MIQVIRWHASAGKAEQVALADLPRTHAELHPEEVVWFDLADPTPEEEDRVLGEFLPVHPLTLADITKPRREPDQGAHLPKAEEFADYLFVIVNPLPSREGDSSTPPLVEGRSVAKQPGGEIPGRPAKTPLPPLGGELPSTRGGGSGRISKLARPQLSAVLTHRVLITHHVTAMPCVLDGQAYLARHGQNLRRGPDYLFHLILDGIVDEYAPVVDAIGERLDDLETELFRTPTPDVLAELLSVKREVSYLRKTLILEREVLARLTRGEFELVDEREIAYYRNVYDHLVRYTELVESAREMVSDLMQSHLAAVSNKLNEIMKVLTMVSAGVLPMTLIAGVYGMNFAVLPEKDWNYGYPFALGLMALTGFAAFIWFKWKTWI
jgi:magnesium transporter